MTKKIIVLIPILIFLIVRCSSDSEAIPSNTSSAKPVSQKIKQETNEVDEINVPLETEGLNTPDKSIASPTIPLKGDQVPSIEPPVGIMETHIPGESTPPPAEVIDNYDFHKYEKLNTLLKKYVSSAGKVNYSGIKSTISDLNSILKEFQLNYPKSEWSKNKKLAYWINAYNIYTIKLIVDNYPTTSITKITAEPWKKKFIKLGGSSISLNHIENEIIRKKFNEPRIHFALNCASKSCPVLLNMAYTQGNLQSKLTSQTKKFLNDPSKNKFGKKEIFISKLFEWYATDFTKSGSVIDFINMYRTDQLGSPKIKYMEYSWDLNN